MRNVPKVLNILKKPEEAKGYVYDVGGKKVKMAFFTLTVTVLKKVRVEIMTMIELAEAALGLIL